jgi:hypothetical protein
MTSSNPRPGPSVWLNQYSRNGPRRLDGVAKSIENVL